MIVTAYGLIVFPLVVWIGVIASKTSKAAERYGTDMIVFAYPAIPSRHEVHGKTLPVIEGLKILQTHKTIKIIGLV